MEPKRIVITGGPGTGKTTLITALENADQHCFHEVIRDMTLEAKNTGITHEQASNPLAFVKDPADFNEKLLNARLADFNKAVNIKKNSVFYDRGLPDVLAYMNYFKQAYPPVYEDICTTHRYDQVLILSPWKEIYIQDNERMENFEEALAIHKELEDTYKSLGYAYIDVPFGNIETRTDFVMQLIYPDHE